MIESWTCHICGQERPDALIGVWSTKRRYEGVEMKENVRYCKDNPECFKAAQKYSFLPVKK